MAKENGEINKKKYMAHNSVIENKTQINKASK